MRASRAIPAEPGGIMFCGAYDADPDDLSEEPVETSCDKDGKILIESESEYFILCPDHARALMDQIRALLDEEGAGS